MYTVTKLDNNNQPIAGIAIQMQGTVDYSASPNKCNPNPGKKIITVNGQQQEVNFDGFDPGTYKVELQATIKMTNRRTGTSTPPYTKTLTATVTAA